MHMEMIDDSHRERPPRAGRLGLTLLLLTLSGCVTGVLDENGNEVAQKCPDPLQGSRYSVCGRLSSSGFSNASGGKRVLATVDSAHEKTSSRYTLQGGTFHAYR